MRYRGCHQRQHARLFPRSSGNPARVWLRWPLTQEEVQQWQSDAAHKTCSPRYHKSAGWHAGFGANAYLLLPEIHCNQHGKAGHRLRPHLKARTPCAAMRTATIADETTLAAYLHNTIRNEDLHIVILPLLHAYLLDHSSYNATITVAGHRIQHPVRPIKHVSTKHMHGSPALPNVVIPRRLQRWSSSFHLFGPYAFRFLY